MRGALEPLAGLERSKVGDALEVGVLVAWRRREPGVEDLRKFCVGRRAQAERKDVRVVPAARSGRGDGVMTKRRADAGNLVRRDRGAGAGPAADDCLISCTSDDVTSGGST